MTIAKKFFKIVSNPQIMSALIWAFVLLGCSYVSKNQNVATILIMGAGFHVVMMSQFSRKGCTVPNDDNT